MKYLTYDKYTYLGGTVDESTFDVLESRARHKLDYITQGSLKDSDASIPDEVEECIFQFINLLEVNKVDAENISSYSNGVESFSYTSKTVEQLNSEFMNIAKEYLYGTNLLYRGGAHFEYI